MMAMPRIKRWDDPKDIVLLDYESLATCLQLTRNWNEGKRTQNQVYGMGLPAIEWKRGILPYYVPSHMGCGNAGGNWLTVTQHLDRAFEYNYTVCNYEGS